MQAFSCSSLLAQPPETFRSSMSADENQRQLSNLWKMGRDGSLSPWSQAKAWGLKHAWELTHEGGQTHGRNTWIAERLCLEGKPRRHPSAQAISQLMSKMEDDEWFPGKICGSGSLGGRPSALSETNKAVVAKSAMALKE